MLQALRTHATRAIPSAGGIIAARTGACTCSRAIATAVSPINPTSSSNTSHATTTCAHCASQRIIITRSMHTLSITRTHHRITQPRTFVSPLRTTIASPSISHINFRFPSVASFSTTAGPSAKESASSSSKGEAGPESDPSGKQSSGKEDPSGDGEAGAEFNAPPPKSKWPKRVVVILSGAAFFYALSQGYVQSGVATLLENTLLNNMKKNGPSAIPEPGSWSYSFLSPSLVGGTEACKRMLIEHPETLDRLIHEGLRIPGLESSSMGVSSEALNLDDIVRANWILSMLMGALSGGIGGTEAIMVQALRAAHARSMEDREEFDKKWTNDEKFRQQVIKTHLIQREHLSPEEAEHEVAQLLSKPLADQKIRFAPILREQRPMTVLDILIQHGMHLKSKDTPEKYEEEVKVKFWKAQEAKFNTMLAETKDEEQKKKLLSVEYQQAERAKNEKLLSEMLDSKRPLFQRLIQEQVEKQLNISSWSILRTIAEPPFKGSGLMNGSYYAVNIAACEAMRKDLKEATQIAEKKWLQAKEQLQANGGNATVTQEEVQKLETAYRLTKQDLADIQTTIELRKELLQKWLLPLCFVITSTNPGTPAAMAKWGFEASSSASDLLGSVLFDIPDLGPTFKRAPQLVQNALFAALAQLAQVYSESNYPGGAVRAAELVIQCDPNNVQILSTLATEKIKLGIVQQMAKEEDEKLRAAEGSTAAPTPITPAPSSNISADPRLNPYLPEALSLLKRALEIDPKHLDANFQFLRLLVSSGERDEKVLGSAAERLIKAIRHSPTVLEPQGIAALPGQSHESLAPLAETVPQLSPAYNLLIRTLEKLGRQDEASELAQEWSFRCHADALSHFTSGRLALKENDLETAEQALRTAYDLDPSKSETLYQLALLKYKAGDLTAAEEYVQQALSVRKKNEQRVRERVNQALLSKSLSSADPQSQGPPRLQKYAVANTIPSIHLLRAKIFAKRGQTTEALSALDEFEREKPLATEGLIFRAKLLQQESRHREAYATFTRLLQVWEKRILAPVPVLDQAATERAKKQAAAARQGKDGKTLLSDEDTLPVPPVFTTRPATTRKAYFDDRRHAQEKAIFEQLVRTCTKPTEKAAAEQWQKNLEELTEFKNVCEGVQRLKNIK